MELPLYSAVVRVVRHRALLEHFFFTIVCRQGRLDKNHVEKNLRFFSRTRKTAVCKRHKGYFMVVYINVSDSLGMLSRIIA